MLAASNFICKLGSNPEGVGRNNASPESMYKPLRNVFLFTVFGSGFCLTGPSTGNVVKAE